MTEANWKKVQPQIHDILAFTQTLGYLPCFYTKDIQLLLEATNKHYLWHTTILFESKDLELTMLLAERLKYPKIPQLTEPHWVLKEWDDIMFFMLCGQHLLLPVVPGQLEDPPRAKRPKGQDRRDPPETPTKQRSAPEVSTGSLTGIVPEDEMVEHTSDIGNPNNGENEEDQPPPLGRGTTAGGGDDDGYDSSSSSGSSSSGSSVYSHRSIRKPKKKVKKIKKQTDRGKTPEQQQWEMTTGIVTPETSSKMSKWMKGIKIDPPENLNSGDKKWRDLQYLDTWVNAIQRWLSMKGIRLESKEALEFIGFKLQGSALTTYNHHLLKEKDKASFFSFMLVLREFLIPSTRKDLLWKEWEAASPHKDGRHIGIKTFANWLEELQIKLIDRDGNQCISEEVKRRKFLNLLPDYMETTLVPQILDSWTFNDLVKKAESYEAARKHGHISTTPKPARHPATLPAPNPSRNHHRDRKTDNKKRSSNPGRTPVSKITIPKDPDWEVVNKSLTSQDKMKLIWERKCLWCRAPGHSFKECKKRISKIPMRTAAQVLSLQHTNKLVIAKNNYNGKTKAKPQSTEELDYSRVRAKVNGHPAIALVDLHATGGDLINAQFVHLYSLPTYGIDKKSLNTAIKGSNGVIEKACDVQMDYGEYTETRTLYVAHLAGWDIILGKPAIITLNILIPAGPKPVTIQPEGMARFALKE